MANGARKTKSAITAITVRNYKSICQEQRLELRPLTLLAGANSSGKSSIMQPLLLLKQTLEAPFDPGPLLLDGPNVRFTSTEQLFCKVESSDCDSFAVKFEMGKHDSLEVVFNRNRQHGVAVGIEGMSYVENGALHWIHTGMSSDEIENILPKHIKELRDKASTNEKREVLWEVARDRCFLNFNMKLAGRMHKGLLFGGISPASLVGPQLEKLFMSLGFAVIRPAPIEQRRWVTAFPVRLKTIAPVLLTTGSHQKMTGLRQLVNHWRYLGLPGRLRQNLWMTLRLS